MLGGLLFKICFFDHKLYLQVVLFIIERYRGNTVQFPLLDIKIFVCLFWTKLKFPLTIATTRHTYRITHQAAHFFVLIFLKIFLTSMYVVLKPHFLTASSNLAVLVLTTILFLNKHLTIMKEKNTIYTRDR